MARAVSSGLFLRAVGACVALAALVGVGLVAVPVTPAQAGAAPGDALKVCASTTDSSLSGTSVMFKVELNGAGIGNYLVALLPNVPECVLLTATFDVEAGTRVKITQVWEKGIRVGAISAIPASALVSHSTRMRTATIALPIGNNVIPVIYTEVPS
jgi:hypothetical protein